MQYAHGTFFNSRAHSLHVTCQGISSVSARPFSPPVAFRTIERQNPAKNERTNIQEGKCHRCKKWILVESIKNIDIKASIHSRDRHLTECIVGERTVLVRTERGESLQYSRTQLHRWKHAAACHQGTHIEGDDDFFLDDDIYRRAQQAL